MFDTETAFRHFHCNGVVHRRKRLGKIIFKCATCWEWSYDLIDLVTDPRLRCPAHVEESSLEMAETPAD